MPEKKYYPVGLSPTEILNIRKILRHGNIVLYSASLSGFFSLPSDNPGHNPGNPGYGNPVGLATAKWIVRMAAEKITPALGAPKSLTYIIRNIAIVRIAPAIMAALPVLKVIGIVFGVALNVFASLANLVMFYFWIRNYYYHKDPGKYLRGQQEAYFKLDEARRKAYYRGTKNTITAARNYTKSQITYARNKTISTVKKEASAIKSYDKILYAGILGSLATKTKAITGAVTKQGAASLTRDKQITKLIDGLEREVGQRQKPRSILEIKKCQTLLET